MQIPYDLEFVENRPTSTVRAIALPQPVPAWRSGSRGHQPDAFDALLAWAHRMLRRLEQH